MEQPLVFWVPAIATSGLTFYTGDRFPNWKGHVFVGGLRQGEVPRSGHLERIDFNDKCSAFVTCAKGSMVSCTC
jgi:aldose sugar dehydrogenase